MKLSPLAEQGYNLHGIGLLSHYWEAIIGFFITMLGGLVYFFITAPKATLKVVGQFLFWIILILVLAYFLNPII